MIGIYEIPLQNLPIGESELDMLSREYFTQYLRTTLVPRSSAFNEGWFIDYDMSPFTVGLNGSVKRMVSIGYSYPARRSLNITANSYGYRVSSLVLGTFWVRPMPFDNLVQVLQSIFARKFVDATWIERLNMLSTYQGINFVDYHRRSGLQVSDWDVGSGCEPWIAFSDTQQDRVSDVKVGIDETLAQRIIYNLFQNANSLYELAMVTWNIFHSYEKCAEVDNTFAVRLGDTVITDVSYYPVGMHTLYDRDDEILYRRLVQYQSEEDHYLVVKGNRFVDSTYTDAVSRIDRFCQKMAS